MRALARTYGLQCTVKPASSRQSLPGWPGYSQWHRPPLAAATGAFASSASSDAASSSSGSSNASSATSANGWLLDAASASSVLGQSYLAPAGSTSSSSSSSSSGQYDAIMMLGGGLLPGGGLPQWVVRRLEGCLFLYTRQVEAARLEALGNGDGGSSSSSSGSRLGAPPIVLLGAGTPHKPPVIDGNGYVVHESTAYAHYLMQRGVPAGDLLKEAQSYDTVGNGYFSLLMHALPAGWRRIAVVTSDFHMPRTQATFDFIYGLAGRQLYGDAAWFEMHYLPVSDEGLFPLDVLTARAEKEAAAVAAWQRNTAGMESLADLHRWLYATHLCYSVSRQHEFGREKELDPKLAATY